MEEKKLLLSNATDLLQQINDQLKDEPLLSTINSLMVSVCKNLNEIVVKSITNGNEKQIEQP